MPAVFRLVLRPRGCTRDLFRSLRSRGSIRCYCSRGSIRCYCSRGSIRCRGRLGQIHWYGVADLHMPSCVLKPLMDLVANGDAPGVGCHQMWAAQFYRYGILALQYLGFADYISFT